MHIKNLREEDKGRVVCYVDLLDQRVGSTVLKSGKLGVLKDWDDVFVFVDFGGSDGGAGGIACRPCSLEFDFNDRKKMKGELYEV